MENLGRGANPAKEISKEWRDLAAPARPTHPPLLSYQYTYNDLLPPYSFGTGSAREGFTNQKHRTIVILNNQVLNYPNKRLYHE